MATRLRPDPTFYPSPKLAMEAPRETFGYTANLCTDGSRPDALSVVDLNPDSAQYGQIVHQVVLPHVGDELHHFGWNACSSMLCPLSGHPFVERRYLVVPGIRSSRIYIIDTKPDPTQARIVKTIEPEEVMRKTGYSRPHTTHCGPEGIYVSCLGGKGPNGDEGPAGIFLMDCETFDILGPWEMDHGEQRLAYDFWWHIAQHVAISSEWALPPQFEGGLVPEDLLSNKYGHRLHFWDLGTRRITQTLDLGANHQMALEVRPAHEPAQQYGFVGVVVNTENLNGEIWLWYKDQPTDREFQAKKVIDIPPAAASPDELPELLKGFSAVPALITDIDLSLDDRFLYVSCWGLGELHQYDVSDPHHPTLAGKVEIGGIARHAKHPNGRAFGGGPQMVEISRDGERVYFTNSLYSTWDEQFYPEGIPGVQVMCDADPNGGLRLNEDFYVAFPDGYRAHQVRLEGGDSSTDSFCYPSVH
ncbi:selenium-binding protein [Ectothiorhodospiraceae bacterium 2226]|nr:selenium-binding protein [Ectothiorhodospiraceae bacterium 2226]